MRAFSVLRRGATDLCLEHSREIIYILEADVERDVSDGCVRRYQKHFRALRSDEGYVFAYCRAVFFTERARGIGRVDVELVGDTLG